MVYCVNNTAPSKTLLLKTFPQFTVSANSKSSKSKEINSCLSNHVFAFAETFQKL